MCQTSRAGSDESQKRSKFPIASKKDLLKSFLEIYAENVSKRQIFGIYHFLGMRACGCVLERYDTDKSSQLIFRVSNDFRRIFLMGGSSRIFNKSYRSQWLDGK